MKYYNNIKYIFFIAIISTFVWYQVYQPKELLDIYIGIRFLSRPAGYLWFLSIYLLYTWPCMGIVERKFSEGGIYYLVRSKSHPSILRALNKELMLSIIKMEVVKLTCYCGCLFLLRPFKSFHIDIHILGACIRMMVIMYFVCLLQIYFESLFSSTVAFILIFMVGLFGIFIGDYIYYHGFSKKIILLASSNLTMHLRYLWLGINNIIIVMLMLLKILLLESILYFHLKKKDFIA